MITYNTMRGWSAIKEQVENEHVFNYFKNSMGIHDLATMYGVKTANNNAPAIQGKSKDYNLVNREYSQCIAEVELYKQSLDMPLSDMQRKIRDIDRVNPNNYEDFYQAMGAFTTLKKEQLNAITQKASMIKNKHELLLKITKQENEVGGSGGGGSNPATNMAAIFKNLPTNNNYTDAVFKGEIDVHVAEAKSKEDERIALVTGGHGQDLGRDTKGGTNIGLDGYAIAKTKHGDNVKEVYCADKRGFGYVEYTDPDGNSGVRPAPLGLFKTQYVDYSSMTVIDSAKMMYPVKTVDSIPTDIEKEWLEIYPDGVNRLAARD